MAVVDKKKVLEAYKGLLSWDSRNLMCKSRAETEKALEDALGYERPAAAYTLLSHAEEILAAEPDKAKRERVLGYYSAILIFSAKTGSTAAETAAKALAQEIEFESSHTRTPALVEATKQWLIDN